VHVRNFASTSYARSFATRRIKTGDGCAATATASPVAIVAVVAAGAAAVVGAASASAAEAHAGVVVAAVARRYVLLVPRFNDEEEKLSWSMTT
jgi:hypothetical protein